MSRVRETGICNGQIRRDKHRFRQFIVDGNFLIR